MNEWMKTMKKLLLTIITLCCLQLHLVSAQAAELEQLALNIEKLAQFKQILSDMKKGYEVIFKGYNTIKDISEGNFNVHKKFLDGLLAVNPELARYKRVSDIIRYQGYILTEYRTAYGRFVRGNRFTDTELDYMAKVYKNLFDQSLGNLEELAMIITAGELRMNDEERISSIDRIFYDMEDKLSFLRGFNKRASILDAQREKAELEVQMLKKIYDGH